MAKKGKSKINAGTQPKPKIKKYDSLVLVLFALACYQNVLLAIIDRNWVPAWSFWSIAKIIHWIIVNFEVSSELGRRYKLEHNQLR